MGEPWSVGAWWILESHDGRVLVKLLGEGGWIAYERHERAGRPPTHSNVEFSGHPKILPRSRLYQGGLEMKSVIDTKSRDGYSTGVSQMVRIKPGHVWRR